MKLVLFILSFIAMFAGKVVDPSGQPIAYATVYPESQPEAGTATNNDGYFSFKADLPENETVIISFIGYEKMSMTLRELNEHITRRQPIVLKEQPIALQETVIAAKASKQRNKRKQMSALLHAVYVQLEKEFPDTPSQYRVVSDVCMLSDSSTWGMEQMIADVVVIPEEGKEGRDSVQFSGRSCKRFFDVEKRAQADTILAGEALERIQKDSRPPKGTPANMLRRAANAIDSGVVIHQALFSMGNMRYDFEQAMSDVRHWTVSNESEGETVLTHTEKTSKYLGCFRVIMTRHYIVDSETYAVRRFSEHAEVKITIPFGVKLNKDQLQMLNLINMDDNRIEKFRLKKMRSTIDYNTIYQRADGHVYTLEKNMHTRAHIIGSKKREIPLDIKATQRVTSLQTKDVKPMRKSRINKRVQRKIVEIY